MIINVYFCQKVIALTIFSVSDINNYIKNLFDKDGVLNSIFIRGEISNFKRHHSGHCYFTLKDAESMLRSVMFRSRAQFVKFVPRDGLKVIAGGKLTVFERDGQYQMYVDQLIPDGMGELSLAFEQLKEKLAQEGLFEEGQKRPLPLLPKAVGIVTSPTGAAIRDIVTVAKRRHPSVSLLFCPVQVQGTEAPPQIVQAIQTINNHGKVDVMIVGRGGGSLEELWAFNDERVVRAIHASKVPVVSAVGHETDFTLADFAADVRAATPSQAAELAVPDVRELIRYIITLSGMLETGARRGIEIKKQYVKQLRESRLFNRPQDMLVAQQQTVDVLVSNLYHLQKKMFTDKQHRFQIAAEKLAILSPLSVLARGYSISRNDTGEVLYSASETKIDQYVEVILSKGKIGAKVIEIEEENNVKQTF
jgi:exodeoxyribonuclease VII large subunit